MGEHGNTTSPHQMLSPWAIEVGSVGLTVRGDSLGVAANLAHLSSNLRRRADPEENEKQEMTSALVS
jgi:hypothetical protein